MPEHRPEVRRALAAAHARRLALAADVRRRGRATYIWRYVWLRQALPVLVVAAAVLALTAPAARLPVLGPAVAPFVAWLVLLMPVALVAGTLWGLWLWRVFERRWFPLLDGGPGGGDAAP